MNTVRMQRKMISYVYPNWGRNNFWSKIHPNALLFIFCRLSANKQAFLNADFDADSDRNQHSKEITSSFTLNSKNQTRIKMSIYRKDKGTSSSLHLIHQIYMHEFKQSNFMSIEGK